MKRLKYATIIGIVFVLILGSLAHFFYQWTGENRIVGLFTPINESVWEHMKLLFFPMLLYGLFMIAMFKRSNPCITSALCAGITAGTLLIPILFYAYTGLLGKDFFVFDIGTFIASVTIAFWISYRLTRSCRQKSYTLFWCVLVCILFVCFLRFTYHPLAFKIFQDFQQ